MKNLKFDVLAVAMGAVFLLLTDSIAFAYGVDGTAIGHRDYGGRMPSQARRDHANRLSKIDENGDGVVALDEYSTSLADRAIRRFDFLDANDDSVISAEEYDAGSRGYGDLGVDQAAFLECMEAALDGEFTGRPIWGDLIAETDTNQDGSIDEAEFVSLTDAKATERFAAIDTNGDDALDETELQAVYNQIRERRQALRTCRMEQLEANILFGF